MEPPTWWTDWQIQWLQIHSGWQSIRKFFFTPVRLSQVLRIPWELKCTMKTQPIIKQTMTHCLLFVLDGRTGTKVSLHEFLYLDKIAVISVSWEHNCLEAAELETDQGYMEASLNPCSAQNDEWLSMYMKCSQSQGGVGMCEPAIFKLFQLINRGFIFAFPLLFQQQQMAFPCNWLWKAVCLVCESLCGSSPAFFPPLNRSVESQFISPRLQFLLFIVWKLVCIEMKRNHILICLGLAWMW